MLHGMCVTAGPKMCAHTSTTETHTRICLTQANKKGNACGLENRKDVFPRSVLFHQRFSPPSFRDRSSHLRGDFPRSTHCVLLVLTPPKVCCVNRIYYGSSNCLSSGQFFPRIKTYRLQSFKHYCRVARSFTRARCLSEHRSN